MGNWPQQMFASGSMGNFGGVDAISWEPGMAEYALAHRAVFGFGAMTSPTWLAANDPEGEAPGARRSCSRGFPPACGPPPA